MEAPFSKQSEAVIEGETTGDVGIHMSPKHQVKRYSAIAGREQHATAAAKKNFT